MHCSRCYSVYWPWPGACVARRFAAYLCEVPRFCLKLGTLRVLSLMSKCMSPFSSDADIVGLPTSINMLHLHSQRGCTTQIILPEIKDKPCQAPPTRADETSFTHLCWSLSARPLLPLNERIRNLGVQCVPFPPSFFSL